jgi:hypothetical protein
MSYPGKPTIYNLTLTSANTEYSQSIPEYTSKIMIKCRTSSAIKLSYTSGESGSLYMTIPSGQTYWDDNIGTASTIYLQSTSAGVVAEILCWSGA